MHSNLLAEKAGRFRGTRWLRSVDSVCGVEEDFEVVLSVLGRMMVTDQ